MLVNSQKGETFLAGSYFKQDNTSRQQLLTNVELVLRNPDISQEEIGKGVSTIDEESAKRILRVSGDLHISTIKLEDKESKNQ